jgi:hypothetical protein
MVQVSAGATYDPKLVPNFPPTKPEAKPKDGAAKKTAEGCCGCDESAPEVGTAGGDGKAAGPRKGQS